MTPDWVNLSKVVWIVLWLQPLALGFIKLSVLFFYRRIISVSKTFNILSWFMIAVTIGWMIAFFFGLFFDCGTNISDNWGSLATIGENCPFGFLPTIIYTILDACLDLFVLVLPIPWVCYCSGFLALASADSVAGFPTSDANVQKNRCCRMFDARRIVSCCMNFLLIHVEFTNTIPVLRPQLSSA